MKKIEAIIRRTKFDDVKDALLAADIEWFSYYEVRGVGKMREARIYRGVAYDTSSIERMLLSIVVRDKNVENCASRDESRLYGRNRRRAHLHHSGRGFHTDPYGRAWRHCALQRGTREVRRDGSRQG